MKRFLPVVFTTLCSFTFAQESTTTVDTTATSHYNSDSASFVFRTDVLDLMSTLIEGNSFKLKIGLEFILNKNYSIRLQASTDHITDRFFSTTEFRSGPEVIMYFGKNVNGTFYSGVFLEYIMYKLIKYDGNLTKVKMDSYFSPGITAGYCYVAAKHFIVEPSLRIGYSDIFERALWNVRIGLNAGYVF